MHRENGFRYDGSELKQVVDWVRYVDDILNLSRRYYSSCVSVYIKLAFEERLTVVSESMPLPPGAAFEWIDLELIIVGASLHRNLTNPNRAWLFEQGALRKRAGCVPVLAASPRNFASCEAG